jgi:protein TonB
MLGGFDPRFRDAFFVRRRTGAVLGAVLVYLASLGLVMWMQEPEPEPEVEVQLEPQISDFDVEEEEPEPEPEPEPPPPPDTKVKVVDKPKPKPKLAPPDKKVDEAVAETDADKTVEVGPGTPQAGGTGTGETTAEKPKAPKPKAPEPEKPKPKPKAKADKIDPTQPIDRPENATAPKPLGGNPKPEYPSELRDKGITGSVLLKLHVHRDGTVRGAKILRKKNNATTQEDGKRADQLFLKAVIGVVKNWKYEPAKLNGQPITVWHKVNIPFSLTAAD